MNSLYLTIKQLDDVVSNNDYIIATDIAGRQYAFNTKIRDASRNKSTAKDSDLSNFVKCNGCSFQEYISKKIPFLHFEKY